MLHKIYNNVYKTIKTNAKVIKLIRTISILFIIIYYLLLLIIFIFYYNLQSFYNKVYY